VIGRGLRNGLGLVDQKEHRGLRGCVSVHKEPWKWLQSLILSLIFELAAKLRPVRR